jgi:hypothetical protein
MNRRLVVSSLALVAALTISSVADAKGSVSSSRGSSSSISRPSSPAPSYRPSSPAPSYTAPTTSNKGSFNSATMAPKPVAPSTAAPIASAPKAAAPTASTQPAAPQTRSVTTTSTTTTTTRSPGGRYVDGGTQFGGLGMGYGYSNGLLTGIIIGNLMHPPHTTVYTGPGYGAPAVLHPSGAVVNQQGYQVGTYQNGQFVATQNGQMLAQQAPADAFATPQFNQPAYAPPPPPKPSWTFGEVFSVVFLLSLIGIMVWFLFFRNRNA